MLSLCLYRFPQGSLVSTHIPITFCGISYFKLPLDMMCVCMVHWNGVPSALFLVRCLSSRFTMTLTSSPSALTEDEWMNKDSHILKKLEKPFIISALPLSQFKHNPNMSRMPKTFALNFIYSKHVLSYFHAKQIMGNLSIVSLSMVLNLAVGICHK